MTTATTAPPPAAPPSLGSPGPAPLRLLRSELLKIRTTNLWWIFALVTLALTAMTFFFNAISASITFDNAENVIADLPEQDAEVFAAVADVVFQAANLYTSGQFLGLMLVLVIGAMLVTTEFHHQTATATFLTTPHRSAVIVAKFVASILVGGFYWLISLAFNAPATALFLTGRGLGAHLTDPAVVRAILLNLLAYVLWAILGVGLGVLLRSQIAAIVTGILLYVAGFIGAAIIFTLLANWFDTQWLLEWQVIVPSIASQLMVAGTELPGSPPQWVGAVVLIAWTAVAGAIGILITRRRDIG